MLDSVALLAEGVDRNPTKKYIIIFLSVVALLAEGVDRNRKQIVRHISVRKVALLAEGVDRNASPVQPRRMVGRSPSSQRAWIEIKILSLEEHQKEQSPSSRRAWIEINLCEGCSNLTSCRPPRGGRG